MNLVKLALAAERFAQTQPPITVRAMQCVRARDKTAACDRCVEACPAGAIQLENGVQLDTEACIRCGLCLHACPTDVFSGTDDVHRLLFCASQLVDREILDVACAMHPDPASTDPKTDAVITTTGCLAALGASAYLSLAAQNVREVRVRLDACARCPLATLQPAIEAAVERAAGLLDGLDDGHRVVIAEPAQRPKRRPVYSVRNPPVSRRGLFQALSQRGRDLLPTLEGVGERHRLIEALRQLAPDALDQPMPGSDFAALTASDACTACTTCARICPTGALEFARSEEAYQLTFSAATCVNCGLCIKYCEPGALQHSGSPSIGDVIAPYAAILHEGTLRRCRRCNAPFAGHSDDGLCPICSFRRQHPFGAQWKAPAFPKTNPTSTTRSER
ncbi:MAG: 4Fe-4S binding protein [Anaerolineae bacterium]|nr:4Fe-4S binding protein [Anaerolineae bacterium]